MELYWYLVPYISSY